MRFYEWLADDVQQLFANLVDSLREKSSKRYELGRILAVKECIPDCSHPSDIWEVADDQQRFVALCLNTAET